MFDRQGQVKLMLASRWLQQSGTLEVSFGGGAIALIQLVAAAATPEGSCPRVAINRLRMTNRTVTAVLRG